LPGADIAAAAAVAVASC